MGLLSNQTYYQKKGGLLSGVTFYQKPQTGVVSSQPTPTPAPALSLGATAQTTPMGVPQQRPNFQTITGEQVYVAPGAPAPLLQPQKLVKVPGGTQVIKQQAQQGAQQTGKLASSVVQTLARETAANVAALPPPIGLNVPTQGRTITPQGTPAKALFGSEPFNLQTVGEEYPFVPEGSKVAPFLAVAGFATNFLGGIGDDALKAIVKVSKIEDAIKIGRQIGVQEDLLETFAAGALKTKTPQEARQLVESVAKLQATSKFSAIPKLDETRSARLTPELQQVEKTAFAELQAKTLPKAVEEYVALNDNIVSTDRAKSLFNVYKTDPTVSDAVQQTAKIVSDAAYDALLATRVGRGNVLLLGGGTGAGKSTALEGGFATDAAVIFEGNLNTVEAAVERIDKALKAGYDVNLQYVYRSPADAFEGVLGRERAVTVSGHVKTHAGIPETAIKVAEKYKDNPKVTIGVIDNSYGKGNAQAVDNVVDFFKEKRYTKEDEARLISQFQRRLDGARAEGRISEQFYTRSGGKTPSSGATAGRTTEPKRIAGREDAVRPAFSSAVKVSPEVRGEVQELIKSNPYERVTNKQAVDLAKERVARNTEEAARYVLATDEPTAEHTATGIELIRTLQAKRRFQEAADIADSLGEKLVKSGQHIQAAKLLERLSPEGVLLSAQKIISKINKELQLKGKAGDMKLEPEFAEKLYDLAKQRESLTDPLLREEIAWEIGSMLGALKKATIGEKVSTAQTIAQLLNPKTMVRNIVGNELFYRFERINKYIATPIDWTKSKLTGTGRTVSIYKDQGKYWSNFLRGARAGWKGVQPGGLPTQLDIGRTVFKSKYNPLHYAEKLMGAGLRGFDFAAYSRAKNETLGELGYLRALNEGKSAKEAKALAGQYAKEADDNILQIAEDYGRYITFQDDNLISVGLQKTKKGLNLGLSFGLGDLALKYPRTPGALLMRAIEYSPAGFLRSAYLIAAPVHGTRDTREIVLATSRAITGTLGFTGMGYYLADKGIITGEPDEDRELNYFERMTGTGQYRINVSALTRWVMSGFKDEAAAIQEGDTLYSYDWAQPVAVAFSIGANMNESVDDAKLDALTQAQVFLSSIEGGVNTLIEQPLVSGLVRLFGYQDVLGGIGRTVQGLPASMIPTLANQLRQWHDNTRRSTYDPNFLSQAINYAKAKIPFAAQTLPPLVDQFGRDAENFQGNSNNIFNVFFNPGFVSRYLTTPESRLVLDVIEATGDKTVVPRIAAKSVTIDGEKVDLSANEYEDYQREIGKRTFEAFGAFAQSEAFMALPDTQKADLMAQTLTDIGKEARDLLFETDTASAVTYKDRLKYIEIQALLKTGEEAAADQLVNKMNDQEYEAYKSVRSSARAKNTSTLRELLKKNPADAVLFLRSQPQREQDRLLDVMTDEEWEIYQSGK